MVVACKKLSNGLVQLTVLITLQISNIHPFVVAAHNVVVLGFESLVEVEGLVRGCKK